MAERQEGPLDAPLLGGFLAGRHRELGGLFVEGGGLRAGHVLGGEGQRVIGLEQKLGVGLHAPLGVLALVEKVASEAQDEEVEEGGIAGRVGFRDVHEVAFQIDAPPGQRLARGPELLEGRLDLAAQLGGRAPVRLLLIGDVLVRGGEAVLLEELAVELGLEKKEPGAPESGLGQLRLLEALDRVAVAEEQGLGLAGPVEGHPPLVPLAGLQDVLVELERLLVLVLGEKLIGLTEGGGPERGSAEEQSKHNQKQVLHGRGL